MKTLYTSFQLLPRLATVLLLMLVTVHCQPVHSENRHGDGPAAETGQKIMLALLLDTSNSMDGLIEQAKSQLWKIVNELAAAKCADGARPSIKIALYEYGNDNLSPDEGYVRQVNGLTDDLDLISEKLFALTTNGGEEYCGKVIQTSLHQLAWSASAADLKLIFIAGNEPFTQGPVSFRQSCARAKEKGVVINTIFCGSFGEGTQTNWQTGATITGGTYMSIEQNQKTVYIPSPYDEKIDALNDRLNNTYVYYGSSGKTKKEAQIAQDKNAESYGQSNKAERAISKSTHAYKNSGWDLVDAAKDDSKAIEKAKAEELPEEMRGMSVEQRKGYIKQKSTERQQIQTEIQELSKKRQEYITAQAKQGSEASMLDAAMIQAIKKQAAAKKLRWQ
ncbi:vWA domain-containing protein [Dawidia soli]|uniref:VWA domain-containing protein n=1 Tax=Dawidia soli TaxID=2782352 RepID=A0AAP2DDM5_9BACT|nr:vWA domain-containing protein [Dawidia soli]MBT1690226.1 VWA domain-containing protein [Dawidia soli]